jgi:putative phosphoribosyl transferase
MSHQSARFADRRDAGRQLARAIEREDFADPIVMALPRGGVPVAFEVATVLGAPLEVPIVRKIGAPGHAELGLGALVDGDEPQLVLNAETMRLLHPPEAYVEAEAPAARAWAPPRALSGRSSAYLAEGPQCHHHRRWYRDGGTAKAAIQALRQAGARAIMLAVPAAPPSAIASLRHPQSVSRRQPPL